MTIFFLHPCIIALTHCNFTPVGAQLYELPHIDCVQVYSPATPCCKEPLRGLRGTVEGAGKVMQTSADRAALDRRLNLKLVSIPLVVIVTGSLTR